MKKIRVMLISLFILLIITGCGLVNIEIGNGVDESGEDALVVVQAEDEPAEPAESNEPVVPETSGDLIPDGVLISTDSENSLTYLDANGQVEKEINLPDSNSIDNEDIIISGAVDPAGDFPPLVFHTWQPEQALAENNNGQVSILRATNSFMAMATAPGQPIVAFSEIIMDEQNNPHSYLYAGRPEDLDGMPAFFDLVDEPYYWALKPVGIETVAGQAQGVWYIKRAWGIGGADLIFAPQRGLYFFDLTNGDNTMHLDDNHNYQGISPDLGFAAYVQSPEMSTKQSLYVVDLATNKETAFPYDPVTDRGAGFAVFSPDNRYAAWLEATGSMISDPYDFHPRIRVGDIQAGGVVQAVEAEAALQLVDTDKIAMLYPVGWLNDEILLIETRGDNWEDVTLLQLEVASGDLTTFASGVFIAFGYH